MSRLKGFAEWADGFEVGDAPDETLEKARLQVCNILGAAYATLNSDGEELTRSVRERTPDGGATVLGGSSADAVDAYHANSLLSMHHDYDDYLFMAHSGHSAVLVSLALCEENGLGGDELLRSVVVANELEGRLGASVVVGPHNGQMWSFLHQAGAAAVTALLEGDGADDIENSLSVALYNPPFPLEPGFMAGDSKSLTATTGCAGIRAGRLALSGATGSPDIMEAERGFFDRFSYLPFPETLTGFGESWVTESLSYKPYPGCAYIQTPVELVEGLDVVADDVEEIEVKASLMTVGMEEMSRPHRTEERLPSSNVTFSVPYSIAVALVADEYATEALSRSHIDEHLDEINGVASKVELGHGWEHTVEAIDGMTQGVAFDDLLGERSVGEKISGFRDFREEHSRVSTTSEFARLLRSGKVRDFLGSFSSPVGGDGFDLGDAVFEDIKFRFGASVTVHADGEVHTAEASDHTGASGRELNETRSTVYHKLRKEAPNGIDADGIIDTVEDLENREVDELTELLR